MKNSIFIVLAIFIFSCKNKEVKNENVSDSKITTETSSPANGEGPVNGISLEKIWESTPTLKTSESVLFDEDRGVYYVSCIGNVPPNKEDGDGFIATLDQKGNVINNAFVTGLDGPKGMAISNGKLYVADINDFVIINSETGQIEQKVAIDGAMFLNDVADAPDGSIYFTDTNTNSIHRYSNGKVNMFLQDETLGNPNGIFVDHETIYLSSFGSGDLNTIDIESKAITQRASNAVPGGDGVAPWAGGFIVSNWNGEVYFSSSSWKTDKVLDTKASKMNAADISINQKSKELLIPTFFGNTVAAYKISNK